MRTNSIFRITLLIILALSIIAMLSTCVLYGIDDCFNRCVNALMWLSGKLDCTYKEINIFFFVAIEPMAIGILAICNYIRDEWTKIFVDISLLVGTLITVALAVLYYVI